jgi:hypothetical protein
MIHASLPRPDRPGRQGVRNTAVNYYRILMYDGERNSLLYIRTLLSIGPGLRIMQVRTSWNSSYEYFIDGTCANRVSRKFVLYKASNGLQRFAMILTHTNQYSIKEKGRGATPRPSQDVFGFALGAGFLRTPVGGKPPPRSGASALRANDP